MLRFIMERGEISGLYERYLISYGQKNETRAVLKNSIIWQ